MSALPTRCLAASMSITKDVVRNLPAATVPCVWFMQTGSTMGWTLSPGKKRVKHWRRSWKIAPIERSNPDWNDLYLTVHLD